MNKFKKLIASLGVAAAIVGGGAVADIATSHNTSKAEAYTYTQGPQKWQTDRFLGSNGRWYCGVWAYVDYSWWEEVTNWNNRDGWKRLYYAYC